MITDGISCPTDQGPVCRPLRTRSSIIVRHAMSERSAGPTNIEGRSYLEVLLTTRVSFVVVNWREAEATAMCVESVKAQEADAEVEIIVVDNESTPDSQARLESIPGIVLLVHKENLGFTGGMNAGFAVATGDYFAAINNDLILGPDWLAAGLAQFADPAVGIVGGIEFLWDEANPAGDTSNEFHSQMFIDGRAGFSYRTDEQITTRDVYALDGNNMLMPRHVVEALGGFDDDFYMYYEDADLCPRALALNYRILFCADMHVWHRRNLSSNRIPYRRQFLAQRNHLVFVRAPLSVRILASNRAKTIAPVPAVRSDRPRGRGASMEKCSPSQLSQPPRTPCLRIVGSLSPVLPHCQASAGLGNGPEVRLVRRSLAEVLRSSARHRLVRGRAGVPVTSASVRRLPSTSEDTELRAGAAQGARRVPH